MWLSRYIYGFSYSMTQNSFDRSILNFINLLLNRENLLLILIRFKLAWHSPSTTRVLLIFILLRCLFDRYVTLEVIACSAVTQTRWRWQQHTSTRVFVVTSTILGRRISIGIVSFKCSWQGPIRIHATISLSALEIDINWIVVCRCLHLLCNNSL